MQYDKAWLKSAVMYNILIDRFARGNGEAWLDADASKPVFCGGNLQGVIDRLDYLQDLGINTLLLSPLHPTPVYHGYHVLDFFGVEPRFGTLETVRELLRQAHAKGIRIILDFTLSHVSRLHPYFVDARSNPESPYRDWFRFTDWPDEYIAFLNFTDLPKFNLSNPDVKDHLAKAAAFWLDLGFDGLRLDHIIGIPHSFLKEFYHIVKERNPQAALIGEAVKGKIHRDEIKTLHLHHKRLLYVIGQLHINTTFFMQRQYVGEMDGVFDFFFRDMVKLYIVNRKWYRTRWLLNLILRVHYMRYPASFSLIQLLDNADHDRFSYMLQGKEKDLHDAVRLQFSQHQPVMLYYGDEAGIRQTESRKYKVYGDKMNGDLAVRTLMPWDAIDESVREFYKELIRNKK